MSDGAVEIRAVPGGVRLSVRVVPRAARTTVGGVRDGCLLVRVTAPPVEGAANAAVIAALARALGRPRRSVTVVAGQAARRKIVEVQGLDVAAARAALG